MPWRDSAVAAIEPPLCDRDVADSENAEMPVAYLPSAVIDAGGGIDRHIAVRPTRRCRRRGR